MFNVEKKSIGDQILSYLRKKIIIGELEEGFHLNETNIARELSVSRGPVRQALIQLEIEKLVEKKQNGRTVVKKFEEKDIIDLYNSRILLESQAIKEMDLKLFNEQYDVFINFHNEMEESCRNDVLNPATDLSFHELIVKLSNNKILFQLWSSIQGITQTVINVTTEYFLLRQEEVIEEHFNIIKALKAGNKEKAIELLTDHLKESSNCYHNVINKLNKEEKI